MASIVSVTDVIKTYEVCLMLHTVALFTCTVQDKLIIELDVAVSYIYLDSVRCSLPLSL